MSRYLSYIYLFLALVALLGTIFLLYNASSPSFFGDMRADLSTPLGQFSLLTLIVLAWTFSLFITHESIVRHDYYLLWAILALLLLGPGVGLPFYLYLRNRKAE